MFPKLPKIFFLSNKGLKQNLQVGEAPPDSVALLKSGFDQNLSQSP